MNVKVHSVAHTLSLSHCSLDVEKHENLIASVKLSLFSSFFLSAQDFTRFHFSFHFCSMMRSNKTGSHGLSRSMKGRREKTRDSLRKKKSIVSAKEHTIQFVAKRDNHGWSKTTDNSNGSFMTVWLWWTLSFVARVTNTGNDASVRRGTKEHLECKKIKNQLM